MYFIFSKLLLFIILPLNWILVLFFVSFFIKDKKNKIRCLISALILLLIFTSPVLLNKFVNLWDYKPDKMQDGTYSCAIVLGGFSSIDQYHNIYFNGASDRFIQAVKLVKIDKASRVLVSGGDGNLFNKKGAEAPYVGKELKKFGLSDNQILLEDKSRNTLENAMFSRKILEKNNIPGPYILVTSAFHMRRSMYLFKKAGLNVVAYPCNYFAGKEDISAGDLMPDANVLGYWNIYIKEVIGLITAHFQ